MRVGTSRCVRSPHHPTLAFVDVVGQFDAWLCSSDIATLPPPGFAPPWSALAAAWDASARAPSTPTVTIGLNTITLGHDDCEGDDLEPEVTHRVDSHEFGWDNESPARRIEVGRVCIEWRPVTNEEYLAFWSAGGQTEVEFPPSWMSSEEGIQVCFFGTSVWVRKSVHCTLYGPVSMNVAKHWPVLTSYNGLLAYAKSKGGRLPTEPELRLFLDMYDVGHTSGANVGFRNWRPVPYVFVFGLDSYPSRSRGALALSMLIHLLLSLQPCCNSFRVTPCAAHCAIHLSPIPITSECSSIVSTIQIVLDIV